MQFDIIFHRTSQTFQAVFEGLQTVTVRSDVEYYTGPYVVTPKAEESQVLPTKDTFLKENVTIKQVPYHEVKNTTGGKTIYIAKEI